MHRDDLNLHMQTNVLFPPTNSKKCYQNIEVPDSKAVHEDAETSGQSQTGPSSNYQKTTGSVVQKYYIHVCVSRWLSQAPVRALR